MPFPSRIFAYVRPASRVRYKNGPTGLASGTISSYLYQFLDVSLRLIAILARSAKPLRYSPRRTSFASPAGLTPEPGPAPSSRLGKLASQHISGPRVTSAGQPVKPLRVLLAELLARDLLPSSLRVCNGEPHLSFGAEMPSLIRSSASARKSRASASRFAEWQTVARGSLLVLGKRRVHCARRHGSDSFEKRTVARVFCLCVPAGV